MSWTYGRHFATCAEGCAAWFAVKQYTGTSVFDNIKIWHAMNNAFVRCAGCLWLWHTATWNACGCCAACRYAKIFWEKWCELSDKLISLYYCRDFKIQALTVSKEHWPTVTYIYIYVLGPGRRRQQYDRLRAGRKTLGFGRGGMLRPTVDKPMLLPNKISFFGNKMAGAWNRSLTAIQHSTQIKWMEFSSIPHICHRCLCLGTGEVLYFAL